MRHYLEIKLLKDPEFAPTMLLNALCNKLHRALAQSKSSNIGISFPHYDLKEKKMMTLGQLIRLHGEKNTLEELMNINWLAGMHDHIHKSLIDEVPTQVNYAVFQRVQTLSNVDRIRRRKMKRHDLTYEEVVTQIPDSVEKRLSLPFLTMKSSSTDQLFRLFIRQKNMAAASQGKFNTYGLSTNATVPLF